MPKCRASCPPPHPTIIADLLIYVIDGWQPIFHSRGFMLFLNWKRAALLPSLNRWCRDLAERPRPQPCQRDGMLRVPFEELRAA